MRFNACTMFSRYRLVISTNYGPYQSVPLHTLSGILKDTFSTSATAKSTSAARPGALRGLKVLDLSRVLAGPFCTQILADYGADVIKVEQPGSGDDTRYWKFDGETDRWKTKDMSNYFAAVNRNKRSVTINLKDKKGKDLIYDMVKKSDILVENFIPGKTKELGVDYDTLSTINPSLIYASISGYGPTGPYADRAGYDIIAAASAGLLHITGEANGPPTKPGVALTDICTGLYTHGAILAAVHARSQTGRGQHITSSLFETQLSVLTSVAMAWLNLGQEAQRWGTGHPTIVPYEAFPTADSHFVVGATNNRQFKILCERVGDPGLAEDEHYVSNDARITNRVMLKEHLSGLFKARKTKDWVAAFEGSGMPYTEVNGMEGAFAHPQTEARSMIKEVEFEAAETGSLKLIGVPVKFSDTEASIRSRPPLLGEQTDTILKEFGKSEEEIESLRTNNVV